MRTLLWLVVLGALVLGVAACATEEEAATGPELVGPTWQWQRFADTAGENDVDVENPENYTLTLMEDGTASIQADCNQVLWQYTLEASSLRFDTTGPSTLAFCGEESLDQLYLERLGNTATYVLEDGMLFLNLQMDSGNLEFVPAE